MSFDFDAAVTTPFRMRPGLRKLGADAMHLTALPPGSRHQREKLAVLSSFPGLALLVRDGFDEGAALHKLCATAAAEHPEVWAWDGDEGHALQLGVAVCQGRITSFKVGSFGLGDEVSRCLLTLDARWRLAALLSLTFAEDFAIINAGDGTVPWLAVTLPSFWAPEEKIGRHFTEVHAPVADNAMLIKAADALMHLVTGPERWERFVWTITPHSRLHAHPAHVDPMRWRESDEHTLPARAWWRSERQTFIAVTGAAQAVFTIAVEVQPLAGILLDAQRARTLFDAVSTMSPAVLEYRGLHTVREPLLRWLSRCAQG